MSTTFDRIVDSAAGHQAARYDPGTNEQYHAGEGVSNSRLTTALDDPAEYEAIHVTKTKQRPAPTPAMVTGTLLHELCLFDEIESAIVVDENQCVLTAEELSEATKQLADSIAIPTEVLNESGHRKGKKYTDWAKETRFKPLKIEEFMDLMRKVDTAIVLPEGKRAITEIEYEQLVAMRDALYAHESAARLLFSGDGESEVAIRMTCPDTGLPIRCRVDRLAPSFAADLKTSRDPAPKAFANSVFNFGYHRQQVFYSRLITALTGEVLPFYFVAINKQTTYRVEVYKLDDDWLQRAETEVDHGLATIARCQDSGIWRHEHYGDVLSLPVPRYVKYMNEWETS